MQPSADACRCYRNVCPIFQQSLGRKDAKDEKDEDDTKKEGETEEEDDEVKREVDGEDDAEMHNDQDMLPDFQHKFEQQLRQPSRNLKVKEMVIAFDAASIYGRRAAFLKGLLITVPCQCFVVYSIPLIFKLKAKGPTLDLKS